MSADGSLRLYSAVVELIRFEVTRMLAHVLEPRDGRGAVRGGGRGLKIEDRDCCPKAGMHRGWRRACADRWPKPPQRRHADGSPRDSAAGCPSIRRRSSL